MAITAITITQDNKSGNIDLLSVHNPLVFLVEVDYTSTAPETLYVELQDEDSTVLDTYAAIPYSDSDSGTTRTFAFMASDILRAYMGEFDDFESPERTLEYVAGITQQFTLRFYIDDIEDSVSFVACHAAAQYGETPYLESIYNNDDETYYGAEDNPVYVYFYNASEGNELTIDSETAFELVALDSDSEIFTDSDGLYFKIL
jgi:hypothetical protein